MPSANTGSGDGPNDGDGKPFHDDPPSEISGIVREHETLAELTAGPFNIKTVSLVPEIAGTVSANGMYRLQNMPVGNYFGLLVSGPVGGKYLPTTNPNIRLVGPKLQRDLSIVTKEYVDGLYAAANVTPQVGSSVVILDLRTDVGNPVIELPKSALSITLEQGDSAGIDTFFLDQDGLNPGLTKSAVGQNGAAYAVFLNVPAGSADVLLSDYQVGAHYETIPGGVAICSVSLRTESGAPPIGDGSGMGGGGTDLEPVTPPPTPPDPDQSDVRFEVDVLPLLKLASEGGANCVGCHGPTGVSSPVMLLDQGDPDQIYEELQKASTVSQPGELRINRDNPEASVMLRNARGLNGHYTAFSSIADPGYRTILRWIDLGLPRSEISMPEPPPDPPPAPDPDLGLGYVPVSPYRAIDTRNSGPIAANAPTTISIPGVPPDAKAVTLSLTATLATSTTYLTVFAGGAALPGTSNMNLLVGESRTTMVTVDVGPNATVQVYNAAGFTHVVIDVLGYYTQASGLVPAFSGAPSRLLDTRVSAPIAAGGTLVVPIGQASILNVTAVDPAAFGYLSLYPSGAGNPGTSNLTFSAGQITSSAVHVAPGGDGNLVIYNGSPAAVHVLLDRTTVFGTYSKSKAAHFVAPTRVLDTRSTGVIPAGSWGKIPITAYTGLTQAAYLGVTVLSTAPGWISVLPEQTATVGTSSINFGANEAASNHVSTKLVNGEAAIYNASSLPIHVIVDAVGGVP